MSGPTPAHPLRPPNPSRLSRIPSLRSTPLLPPPNLEHPPAESVPSPNNRSLSPPNTRRRPDADDTDATYKPPPRLASGKALPFHPLGKQPRMTSGGFLLNASYVRSKASKPQPLDPDTTKKTRQRREDRAYGVLQHTPTRRRHPSSSDHAPRRSPLSTEVKPSLQGSKHQTGSEQNEDPDTISSSPLEGSSGSGRQGYDGHDEKPPTRHTSAPVIGLDSDPAQIVNLALSLNESRRAAAQVSRIPSLTKSGNRGSPSGSLPGLTASGGSLRQHMQELRHSSCNSSPTNGQAAPPDHVAGQLGDVNGQSRVSSGQSVGSDANAFIGYRFSEATLARAARAKSSLELAHEHRRLLHHLPALRPGAAERRENGNLTVLKDSGPERDVSSTQTHAQDTQRAYNPLQTIRNRRIRARESRNIRPEEDGWDDLPEVRSWVDQVSIVKTSPSHDAVSVTLPPFPSTTSPTDNSMTSDAQKRRSGRPYSQRTPRPPFSWLVSPAEALADTYWVEQQDHKYLIVTRDGKKVLARDPDYEASRPRRSWDDPTSPQKERSESPRGHRIDKSVIAELGLTTKQSQEFDTFRGRRIRNKQILNASPLKAQHEADRSHSQSSPSSGEAGPKSRKSRYDPRRDVSDQFVTEKLNNAALEASMIRLLEDEAYQAKNDGEKKSHEGRLTAPPMDRSVSATEGKVQELHLADTRSASVEPPLRKRTESSKKVESQWSQSHKPNLSLSFGGRGKESLDELPPTAPQSPLMEKSNFLSPTNSTTSNHHFGFSSSRSRDASPISRTVSKTGSWSSRTEKRRGRLFFGGEELASPVEEPRSPDKKGPARKLFSRKNADTVNGTSQRSDARQQKSNKLDKDPDSSRLRNIFKSGRIEEIVRTEVSKVGDVIRRRDGPGSPTSTPRSSISSDTSDSKEEPQGLRPRPPDKTQAYGTQVRGDSSSPQDPNEPQRYKTDGLPIFKSPSKVQKSRTESPSPSSGPAVKRELAEKTRYRFEKIGPARVDLEGNSSSPDQSGIDQPMQKQRSGSSNSNDDSQASGSQPRKSEFPHVTSIDGVRSADARLNAMLGLPGKAGRPGSMMISGLAAIEADTRQSHGTGSKERHWSIRDGNVPNSEPPATRRELARVRALLISSGVKAQQIGYYEHEIRPCDPKLFQRAKISVPDGPRYQQYALAGTRLTQDIDHSARLIQDAADKFTRVTMAEIHNRIEEMRQRVGQQITPMVQDTADDADVLSMELTTTHTLTIKQLNDSIDTMIRRRRRRMKWISRTGFLMLEWALLGVMWWAWLIAVVIRLIRGVFGGVAGGIRWLLWLD